MIWTADLAYVVGLITTDGSLSKDGRHIAFTSKDLEQIQNFAKILNLKNKIGLKSSSYAVGKKYYNLQFGNVKLYRFLLSIGLLPNKTKILGKLSIPDKYFADFLRGHLDGDGYAYSFYDSKWKNSYRLYTSFMSASLSHIIWLRDTINNAWGIEGKINPHNGAYYLRFAKRKSITLLKNLYYKKGLPCLDRKKSKIEEALGIIYGQAGMLKLVNRHA